jgi:hypothetical protein
VSPPFLLHPAGILAGLAVLWLCFALLLIKTRRDQGREVEALLMALRGSDIYKEVLTHVRRYQNKNAQQEMRRYKPYI